MPRLFPNPPAATDAAFTAGPKSRLLWRPREDSHLIQDFVSRFKGRQANVSHHLVRLVQSNAQQFIAFLSKCIDESPWSIVTVILILVIVSAPEMGF